MGVIDVGQINFVWTNDKYFCIIIFLLLVLHYLSLLLVIIIVVGITILLLLIQFIVVGLELNTVLFQRLWTIQSSQCNADMAARCSCVMEP